MEVLAIGFLRLWAGQNMPSKLYEGFNLYSFHRNPLALKLKGYHRI